MNELPNWVYDVVIALQKWSDEHPKLRAQYAGSDAWQIVPDCCAALELVPIEVREQAKAIAGYQRYPEFMSAAMKAVFELGAGGPPITVWTGPDGPEPEHAPAGESVTDLLLSRQGKSERTFAGRVRAERLRRGWRQEDLANRLAALGVNLHSSTVAKIELGVRSIRLNEAAAIARLFDVDVDDMAREVA